ncbi:MAG: OmpA family protein [Planctomycetes bacterium]|nr:OmpA family protein [Planctomycetota bacterium]
MPRSRTLPVLAGAVAATALLGGCVSSGKYNELNSRYQAETAGLRTSIEALERTKTSLEKDLAYYRSMGDAKEANMLAMREQLKNLRLQAEQMTELEKWAKAHDVKVLPGGDGVELPQAILFSPGVAEVNAGGKTVLTDLYNNFIKGKDLMLRVDGHTDSDPIKKTRAIYKSGDNYELAGDRALHVTLHLKSLGMDPKHMYFASFGEHQPKAADNSKEAKKANRRVEIHFWNVGGATPGGGGRPMGAPPLGGGGPGAGPGPGPGPGGSLDDELDK